MEEVNRSWNERVKFVEAQLQHCREVDEAREKKVKEGDARADDLQNKCREVE